jgi:hypothetical protein
MICQDFLPLLTIIIIIPSFSQPFHAPLIIQEEEKEINNKFFAFQLLRGANSIVML